jgi:N-acetylglutamate synthase-like GNAT family acetyltransferase
MSPVEFRPTTADDLPHLTDQPLPFRIKAVTALIDGRVVGVGGIGFMPDGVVAATVLMTDEMRAHKFALHRMAKKFLADVAASGIRELVTLADQDIAGAENWLRHLGFRPIERNGVEIWQWQTR